MSAARRKRVAVVTGTRADYGLLRSSMEAIAARPELELRVAAVGMHLLPRFGSTAREIERDGFRIDARVRMQRGDDSPTDQALGLSRGVAGLARFFHQAKIDVALLLGDRIEAMAGALAAVTTGVALAHIHGGDVAAGDFDDALRHAITKLAHLHFPATRKSARRLLRMGERPERVHCVGAPGLDRLRLLLEQGPAPSPAGGAHPRSALTSARRVRAPRHSRPGRAAGRASPFSPYALVVQHAYGRSAAEEQRAAAAVLNGVAGAGLRRCVIFPNSDRGHRGVLRAIERHAARSDGQVRVFRSLPRDAYLRALIGAAVLVGNSSSGLLEAAYAGTPAVCVGERQAARETRRSAVVLCGEDAQAIRAATGQALRKRIRPRCGGPFGDGRAGERIAAILARTPITPELLRKRIAY